jgi:hypothetical protein
LSFTFHFPIHLYIHHPSPIITSRSQALASCGTDFTLLSQYFPGRTRKQVKSKYQREDRDHPERVEAALVSKQPVGTKMWGKEISRRGRAEWKMAKPGSVCEGDISKGHFTSSRFQAIFFNANNTRELLSTCFCFPSVCQSHDYSFLHSSRP